MGRAATRPHWAARWYSPALFYTRYRRSRLDGVMPSCLSSMMRKQQRSAKLTVSFSKVPSPTEPTLPKNQKALSGLNAGRTPERNVRLDYTADRRHHQPNAATFERRPI